MVRTDQNRLVTQTPFWSITLCSGILSTEQMNNWNPILLVPLKNLGWFCYIKDYYYGSKGLIFTSPLKFIVIITMAPSIIMNVVCVGAPMHAQSDMQFLTHIVESYPLPPPAQPCVTIRFCFPLFLAFEMTWISSQFILNAVRIV